MHRFVKVVVTSAIVQELVAAGFDNDGFYSTYILRASEPTLCRQAYCYTIKTDESKTSTDN